MKNTVDNSLAAHLSGIVQRTEIRDADGGLLGNFMPVDEVVQGYVWAQSAFDPAEIDRRKKDPRPGRMTHEVLDRLEALETSIDE